jgi:hypothetical protein
VEVVHVVFTRFAVRMVFVGIVASLGSR